MGSGKDQNKLESICPVGRGICFSLSCITFCQLECLLETFILWKEKPELEILYNFAWFLNVASILYHIVGSKQTMSVGQSNLLAPGLWLWN